MKKAVLLFLSIAWGNLPSTAVAHPLKLAVASLSSPPHLTGISEMLTQEVLRAAANNPAHELIRPTTVERTLGREAFQHLQACGGKAECVTQYALALQADRIIVGTLGRNDNSYLIKIFLVDLKEHQVLSSIDRAVLIASRRLDSEIKAALPTLLKGEVEAQGKLAIVTSSPNAAIALDGESIGRTPLTVLAKPGRHILKVTKAKYFVVERFVTVEAGKTEEVSLQLTAVPGSSSKAEEEGSLQESGVSQGQRKSLLPTGSWIAGAASAAAGGLALYFSLHSRSLEKRAGEGAPSYHITRTEAQSGRRSAKIANGCFVGAGVGAATAIAFALFTPSNSDLSPTPSAPRAGLTPLADGAAMSLSGSF
jgi:hypothetical protein